MYLDSTSLLYLSGPDLSFSHNAGVSVALVSSYNVLDRKVVSIIQNGKSQLFEFKVSIEVREQKSHSHSI